jgi:release factor glutamine methyltransferase
VPSLFETLAAARHQLVSAGVGADQAAVDVPLFACAILGWDRARLLSERSRPVPPSLEPRFSQWIARRMAHEPAAYIVGHREFWGLDFAVTPAVLIPRPETELIVEEAIEIVRSTAIASPDIADIGTGSGNLAISLAYSIQTSHVTATDISRDALTIARQNARTHDLEGRIVFVETTYLDDVERAFDVIVANPPYVKAGDKPALSRAVLHEPEIALFGGDEGLMAVEGVLDASVGWLKPGGWLVMEFGFGQSDDVARLVSARHTLRLDRIRDDLQGIPRTAIIQRAGTP